MTLHVDNQTSDPDGQSCESGEFGVLTCIAVATQTNSFFEKLFVLFALLYFCSVVYSNCFHHTFTNGALLFMVLFMSAAFRFRVFGHF